MGVTISFSDCGEFLAEINADMDLIQDKVVRLTIRRTYGGEFPTVAFALVGTALVGEKMVLLEKHVGSGLHFAGKLDPSGEAAARRADSALSEMEETIRGWGLEVRPGIYRWET
jgi:hypothetical protein